MKVLNLLELRKEAQSLGIENYAKYTKEELAKVIAAKKSGTTINQAEETVVTKEDVETLKEKVAEDGVEIISAEEAAEIPAEQTKKVKKSKEEKAAEKAVARAEEKAAKAAAKAAAKEAEKAKKQAEKEAKKAAKEEAKKADGSPKKKPGSSAAPLKLKDGIETPTFKSGKSKDIFEALLENRGLTHGALARELGTHYNMVRRIAETYFEPISAPDPVPTSEEQPAETEESSAE